MPSIHQVLNLIDLVPKSRAVIVSDPDTKKIASYTQDYGFVQVKGDYTREPDGTLTAITYTVLP